MSKQLTQCTYCNSYSVLDNYCLECESSQPQRVQAKEDNATTNKPDVPFYNDFQQSTGIDSQSNPSDQTD